MGGYYDAPRGFILRGQLGMAVSNFIDNIPNMSDYEIGHAFGYGVEKLAESVALTRGLGLGTNVVRGSSNFLRATKSSTKLPTQIHHFATNKHSVFTKQMSGIADEFGLSLNGAWNKQALPHLGRHPNAYHNFVLEGMQKARAGAGGSQAEFLNLFNQYVKQPVIQNPGLLRKSGW